MSQTIEEAIATLQSQITELTNDINKKKAAVNTLCEVAGLPVAYVIEEHTNHNLGLFRSDEFYGQPLATCAGKILEARKMASKGAMSPDEMYNQLVAGGFKFDSKSDSFAKRSMVIALAKNTAKFHRLPNGDIGLAEWYPNAKKAKNTDKDSKSDEVPDESDPETLESKSLQ